MKVHAMLCVVLAASPALARNAAVVYDQRDQIAASDTFVNAMVVSVDTKAQRITVRGDRAGETKSLAVSEAAAPALATVKKGDKVFLGFRGVKQDVRSRSGDQPVVMALRKEIPTPPESPGERRAREAREERERREEMQVAAVSAPNLVSGLSAPATTVVVPMNGAPMIPGPYGYLGTSAVNGLPVVPASVLLAPVSPNVIGSGVVIGTPALTPFGAPASTFIGTPGQVVLTVPGTSLVLPPPAGTTLAVPVAPAQQ